MNSPKQIKEISVETTEKNRYLNFLFLGISFLIILVIGEIFVRIFIFKKNSPIEEAYLNIIYHNPKFKSQPYLNYINNPDFINSDGRREFNSLSIRQDSPTSLQKEPDILRVLFLGGSTTFGEVNDYRHTAPKYIEASLNEKILNVSKKYKKVECLNAGLPSGTSAELVTHYCFKLIYLNSDIVVINAGINDALVTSLSGHSYNPDYNQSRSIYTDIPPISNNLRPFLKSKLIALAVMYLYYRDVTVLSHEENMFKLGSKPNSWFTYAADSMYSPTYNAFNNNMQTLITVALSRNQQVLLVSESICMQRFCYPGHDSLMNNVYIGFQKNKKFLEQLSGKFNVPLCTLEDEDFLPELYNECDGIHLNENGEMEKAKKIEKSIIQML